jgi:hypothetical protein
LGEFKFYSLSLGAILPGLAVVGSLLPKDPAREAAYERKVAAAVAEKKAHDDAWKRDNAAYEKRCGLSAPIDRIMSRGCREETYRQTHFFGELPNDTITIEVR